MAATNGNTAAAADGKQQPLTLSATYASPANEPFAVTESLPAPATTGVGDKTKYLADLKERISSVQERVNQELTARMEQDKARDAATSGKAAVDDAKEEENYGEEVQEEED
ncbi:uncharacterized protein E0L32_010953 [Thyridium curvatum]|uniref:EKC/KEOPS complex subunit GON7 n=1 Tax=Thyridium curvatum TaxID=1093900 RepID=A0A507AF40_9PEZI|nr:uncharacterized protein E0L32_010953 [Thyridium curvatum]TPX07152.1 hypothetical protein E0L32_010953 [Thyridium curvatum]